MGVVNLFEKLPERNCHDGVSAIRQLLEYAAELAESQDLAELAFLIGVASEAADEAIAGTVAAAGG